MSVSYVSVDLDNSSALMHNAVLDAQNIVPTNVTNADLGDEPSQEAQLDISGNEMDLLFDSAIFEGIFALSGTLGPS